MRGATIEKKCKKCRQPFMARVADVNRGWAKCCSKSCAATLNNRKTGNYQRYISNKNNYMGSGVDQNTYTQYQNEFGGTPQFDNGEYVGFTSSTFDNTAHQNHDRY